MAIPCPKCGDIPAEPMRGNLLYQPAKWLGYQLAQCGRCNRWRLLTRKQKTKPLRVDEMQAVVETVATLSPDPPAPDKEKEQRAQPRILCPVCGDNGCRRSRRTFWERKRGRPPMMRCRKCRERFPSPYEGADAA